MRAFPQLISMLLIGVSLISAAEAEEGSPSIFNRFTEGLTPRASSLDILEIPVLLRPQGDPNALASRNSGLSYVTGSFPRKSLYLTWATTVAQQDWEPSNPAFRSVSVRQIDLTLNLNAHLARRLVLGVGLGPGLMDGLVIHSDGNFTHRLEPYLAGRLGLTAFAGENLVFSATVSASPFWGGRPLISHSRLLIGLGWSH